MSYFPGGRNCGDPELASGRNRRALTTDDLTSLVDDAANYAGQSARSADESAESAALSRNAADDSEASARISQEWAEASEDSATSASGSAAVAVGAKNSALGAADSASDSADDAAASALAAAGSEEGVEADRIAAENARAGAETARGGAEAAQSGAQTAQAGSEAARDLALTYRNEAQSATFNGTVLDTRDLNAVTSSGRYRVTSGSGNTTALGWPFDSFIGVVDVFGRQAGRATQIAYSTNGVNDNDSRRYWMRTQTTSGWSNWKTYLSSRVNNPAGQPGLEYYASTDVQGSGAEIQLGPVNVDISTADLNSITLAGTYRQQASASAAVSGRNYPVPERGVLHVDAVGPNAGNSSFIVQTYLVVAGTHRMRGIYTRRGFFNNATQVYDFESWSFVPSQRVDNTAGRAIYTWDDTANREQLIYGDTGWRNIPASDLLNGWTLDASRNGFLRIRRVGSQVFLWVRDLDGSAAANVVFYNLPAGFRLGMNINGAVPMSDNATTFGLRIPTNGTALAVDQTTRRFTDFGGRAQWDSIDAWPLAPLPGGAFGSIPNA